MLHIGEQAPEFRLLDQNSEPISLEQFHGKHVLVYFYPKDDTPGCTKEACALRDAYNDFKALGVTVIGISKDTPESHQQFAKKYELPFILLSDPQKKTISDYHAKGGLFTRRISYLIDGDGKIVKAYPKVDPAAHAGAILQDLMHILKR